MNTKLALSALVAALMLTACAKQESAGTDQAATPPAPAASPDAADATPLRRPIQLGARSAERDASSPPSGCRDAAGHASG